MIRLSLDLPAVCQNIIVIDEWVRGHGATWTLVTKVLSGWQEMLNELTRFGVDSIAESRLENLGFGAGVVPPREIWYLRPPCLSLLPAIVEQTSASLNSDISVLEALSVEARRQGRVHHVVIMVELGDLREGVPPKSLGTFIESTRTLQNIRMAGIGSNLGCLSGAIPTVDQFSQLALYRELMQLKFGIPLPLISAGTSAVLPMILDGSLSAAVNHFRIGEAVFLGTDLVNGGTIPGLRDDAIFLEAEVVEIREKSLSPAGEILDIGPFEHFGTEDSGQMRETRAVVSMGQLDTAIQGLKCCEAGYRLAGASSDLAVVSIADGAEGCRVGDWIRFVPSYGSLVRLTASKYVDKRILGVAGKGTGRVDLPPVLDV